MPQTQEGSPCLLEESIDPNIPGQLITEGRTFLLVDQCLESIIAGGRYFSVRA